MPRGLNPGGRKRNFFLYIWKRKGKEGEGDMNIGSIQHRRCRLIVGCRKLEKEQKKANWTFCWWRFFMCLTVDVMGIRSGGKSTFMVLGKGPTTTTKKSLSDVQQVSLQSPSPPHLVLPRRTSPVAESFRSGQSDCSVKKRNWNRRHSISRICTAVRSFVWSCSSLFFFYLVSGRMVLSKLTWSTANLKATSCTWSGTSNRPPERGGREKKNIVSL